MIRRRVVVHGRVQGVGFRYAVARRAQARGLAGWVSNRPDGTVEAVFEGDPDAVESLARFCSQGPPGAVVDDVEVVEEAAAGLRAFELR
jgi:acylphosphatase